MPKGEKHRQVVVMAYDGTGYQSTGPRPSQFVVTGGNAVGVADAIEGTPGWCAFFVFVSRDGVLELAEFAARYLPSSISNAQLEARLKEWLDTFEGWEIPRGGLTLTRLRGIRFGDLQTRARAHIAAALRDPVIEMSMPRGWGQTARRRPGRAGTPDRHYAEVAARYEQLVNEGHRAPVQQIANEQRPRVEYTTVRDQLYQARRRGLLTRGSRGVADGKLTDKARALLAEGSR